MDYGKKDPSLGWRFTDAWLSMAGNGDKGLPNGLPVDEWGIKVDENSRPVGSCVARGRRHQRPCIGLFHPEVSRLDEGLCAAGSPGHDLRRIRPGSLAGERRPADVHLHGVHGGLRQARPAGGERGRHAEVAFRAVAAWRLLEGRHEARLPGRGFLDAAEVDAGRPRQGRLALRAVRHLQDRGREEEPCRPDADPREHDPAQVLHRSRPEARRP